VPFIIAQVYRLAQRRRQRLYTDIDPPARTTRAGFYTRHYDFFIL
jgi:hypothetical protein